MWWIIAFVAVIAGIAFVISRRGTGDGLDHSGDPGRHDPLSGGSYPGGFGDGGGGL